MSSQRPPCLSPWPISKSTQGWPSQYLHSAFLSGSGRCWLGYLALLSVTGTSLLGPDLPWCLLPWPVSQKGMALGPLCSQLMRRRPGKLCWKQLCLQVLAQTVAVSLPCVLQFVLIQTTGPLMLPCLAHLLTSALFLKSQGSVHLNKVDQHSHAPTVASWWIYPWLLSTALSPAQRRVYA